ncbi:MAG: hypothetical protein HYY57_06125, partial [Candidatus Omnitrophica bacterium]|nr:hypothetical protein [Candidatus Omnitrophota bacterium]
LFRPTEEIPLVGDASLARQKLGWSYDIPFESLVQEMVEHDLERIREGDRFQKSEFRNQKTDKILTSDL